MAAQVNRNGGEVHPVERYESDMTGDVVYAVVKSGSTTTQRTVARWDGARWTPEAGATPREVAKTLSMADTAGVPSELLRRLSAAPTTYETNRRLDRVIAVNRHGPRMVAQRDANGWKSGGEVTPAERRIVDDMGYALAGTVVARLQEQGR